MSLTAILQQVLRERIDPSATVTSLTIEPNGQAGLILWQRPGEYIVHRWATNYTDGSPVPDGAMFYSGGYYRTLDEADADLRERAR